MFKFPMCLFSLGKAISLFGAAVGTYRAIGIGVIKAPPIRSLYEIYLRKEIYGTEQVMHCDGLQMGFGTSWTGMKPKQAGLVLLQ